MDFGQPEVAESRIMKEGILSLLLYQNLTFYLLELLRMDSFG